MFCLVLVVTAAIFYHKANKTVWFYWLQDWNRDTHDYTLIMGSSSIGRLPATQLGYCRNVVLYGFNNGTTEDLSKYLRHANLQNTSKVIVYIGENDIAQNESPQTTFLQHSQLIENIRAKSSAAIAIVKLKYSPARIPHHANMLTFNKLLETTYKDDDSAQLIAFDSIKGRDYYLSDGIHLNRRGNTIFLNMIDTFCRNN
jgi:lysophospholipase L1-like esterase